MIKMKLNFNMLKLNLQKNILRRGFQSSTLCEMKRAQLVVEKATTLKPKIPNEKLLFGKFFTDHMLEVPWTVREGWQAPKISPYHSLVLDPSATCFHYSLECFEGMKAYKDKQGNIRMFRPMMNMNRFNKSSERLTLPTFDERELLECIKELLKMEESWIPQEHGYSLYIRPTLIGTQSTLGVGSSDSALLFVICCPVGPYYKTGFNPVKLYADPKFVRSWPGGTGDLKVGGNYAPTVLPQKVAQEKGAQQILWLFGPDREITEVGTMNAFIFWINEAGEKELVTAPLDGTILPGVTRDSILALAREWKEFKWSERKWTINDLIRALKEHRVLEMFGAGTASIVSPINGLIYMDQEMEIPLGVGCTNAKAGPLTKRFSDTILAIQYGEVDHPWSVLVS